MPTLCRMLSTRPHMHMSEATPFACISVSDVCMPQRPRKEFQQVHDQLVIGSVTIRTYTTDFYLFYSCTDTGVIVTHALSFCQPLAPFVLLTHAQLDVVTQSCTLLYIAAHCDLLLQ